MEDTGVLGPDDMVHLTALHYVYLSNINERLLEWLDAMAHHKIRTVGRCPYKMFKFGQQSSPKDVLWSIDVREFLNEAFNIPPA